MSIAAALALQSIPFAALVLATLGSHRDLFLLLYAAGLGLTLSVIAAVEGHVLLPALPSLHEAQR